MISDLTKDEMVVVLQLLTNVFDYELETVKRKHEREFRLSYVGRSSESETEHVTLTEPQYHILKKLAKVD